MNKKHSFEPHLALTRTTLQPGAEWIAQSTGWSFLSVSSGVGYWLHPRANHELVSGSALLVFEQASGLVRASQVSEVTLNYCRLELNRLGGLVTFGEQEALQRAGQAEASGARIFEPKSLVAEKFRELCAGKAGTPLQMRLRVLDLFIEALGSVLWGDQNSLQPVNDAKVRLIKILQETPAAELLELSFSELVKQVRCTPRHLSRIFHELVGMSFRQKQAELRLIRAQELLATTQSKVVEVALESGYQSLSLFNLMFKRQFGLTPAKWRDKTRPHKMPQKLPSQIMARPSGGSRLLARC